MAKRWHRWRHSLWYALLTLLIYAVLFVGYARYNTEVGRYQAEASAAHENEQFASAYRGARSGDIITIVGKSMPPNEFQPHVAGHFAMLELKDTDKVIALTGARVPLCNFDKVAASGTYNYEPWGGVLIISDVRNVARWHISSPVGPYALIRLFDPQWCGFPGDNYQDF